MADEKITGLAPQTAPDAADLIEQVDISDTSMAGTGTNKRMTMAVLEAWLTHNNVSARTANDAHPIGAITGLDSTLATTLKNDTGAVVNDDVGYTADVKPVASGGTYAPDPTDTSFVTLTGNSNTTISNENCPAGRGVDFRIKVPALIVTVSFTGWVEKNTRPASGDAVLHLTQTDDIFHAYWAV